LSVLGSFGKRKSSTTQTDPQEVQNTFCAKDLDTSEVRRMNETHLDCFVYCPDGISDIV
jgi:hypothetical protein